jgi:type IV pilus assembly protein PilY1
VLDAFTGNLVWSAGNSSAGTTLSVSGMNFSIAADVLALDRHQTGFVDRAYAADVGGNLWRLDIGDPNTANWKVSKIAAIGDRSAVSSTRKFFYSPDVVFGDAGTFDSIVIGTGDREHPLLSNAALNAVNRAYMFKDPNIDTLGADLGYTNANLFDATSSSSVPPTANGWFVTLAAGEKVVNGPLVVSSSMIFGTNQPCASGRVDDNGNCVSSGGSLSCTGNLGIARRYDINFLNGAPNGYTTAGGAAALFEVAPGGGFLPPPVAGVVEIGLSNYIFVTDNPLSPGGIQSPTINVGTKRSRPYWKNRLE